MSWCLQLSTRIHRPVTICYHVRRHASKKPRRKIENHEQFIQEQTNQLFGPVRNLDGTERPKHHRKNNTQRTSGASYNDSVKALRNTSKIHVDVASSAPQILTPATGRKSIVRELDSILTYPMQKVIADSTELVPSISPDINVPILNSAEVTSLDKKSSLPSVSKILEKSRPPEEQAILDRWKEKMIAELGEDGFQRMLKGYLKDVNCFEEFEP